MFYASDVGEVRGDGRVAILVIGMACVVGLVVAAVSGDTWQGDVVTTVIYGAGVALMLRAVALRPHRPRVTRHNGSPSRTESARKQHP